MIPASLPELIERAGAISPYMREHLALVPDPVPHACVHLNEQTLESAYAPIYDVTMPGATQSASLQDNIARFGDELGFAALTLIDGEPGHPFHDRLDDPSLVALDRLTRALHTINFFGAHRHGLLFLRVHERLLKSVKYDHGKHFSSILRQFGIDPAHIVIELPEAAVAHKTFLAYLTKSYQHHGFKVAAKLPDAGRILAVESDMARPDYVKMNAGLALRDCMVKALSAYAHRMHVPLIFDNVADEAQFGLLRQYDVELMQGPVFAPVAPPAPAVAPHAPR